MSATAQSISQPLERSADRRLVIVGGSTVVFSIIACAAGLLGVLPQGYSSALVMLGMGVALTVAWKVAARSATSASRARIAVRMSNVGLTLSGLAVVVALPRLTKTSGVGLLLVDLSAQLWTLALIAAAAGPARTLGWRALLGAFLFGFLGLTGLARFLGRPLIVALGTSSIFAVGIWVPITEELCKMLPVLVMLWMTRRAAAPRPSLLDLVLLGASAAAGLAVFENATFGRGGFSLTKIALVSLISPGDLKGAAFGWTVIQTGHLVHTALIAIGVGFAWLYRHQFQRTWIVAVIGIAVSLLEHCTQNSIITGGVNDILAKVLLAITFNGVLSTLLLVLGVGYIAYRERKAPGIAIGSAP
jgi:RsiW-degrading membrane proteinase PrsW (M82 family)